MAARWQVFVSSLSFLRLTGSCWKLKLLMSVASLLSLLKKADLELNIQKTKIMTSSPNTLFKYMGKQWKQ